MLIFLLVILILPASAYFLIRTPSVQDYLVHRLTSVFSDKLETNFTIESVDYSLFNKLVLKNVYIEDQQGDSLIYSKQIKGHLNLLDLKDRKLFFQKLQMEDAKIHLQNDSLQSINIQFLVNALKRKDTTKPRMHVKIHTLNIQDSEFSYSTDEPPLQGYGMDFNRIDLDDFNIKIRQLDSDSGKVRLDLSEISFRDKSGFQLLDMDTRIFIHPDKGGFKNLIIRTPFSYINADSVVINHGGYENLKEFIHRVRLNIAIKRSNLGFHDLAFFSPTFQDIPNHNFVFSGNLNGTINNLRGKEVYVAMGNQTEIQTDFSANGLPEISKSFLYVDIERFHTAISDLDIINYFFPERQAITPPKNLQTLGTIKYSGNFTGFIDDFVAYGTLQTNMGELSTDLSIKPKKASTLKINGNLKTKNFDIGGLINNPERFGDLSMDVQVNGTAIKNKGFEAQTEGSISKLQINNYNYKNIELNGLLTDKKYDGSLNIEDPNIKFNFSGGIDFSGEIPVFDFKAKVDKAKLSKLNFVENDSTASLSLKLLSNFEGNSIDNLSGSIQLTEAHLIKQQKKLNVENFKVNAEHLQDTHKIFLQSDFIEGSLIGKYRSSSVHQSLKNLFYSYLPVFIEKQADTAKVERKNNFKLDIQLKNTDPITQIFTPNISISENSSIHLDYSGSQKTFNLSAESGKFRFKNYYIDQLNLQSESQDSIFSLIMDFHQFQLDSVGENNYFNDFELKSLTGQNSSKLLVNWKEPATGEMKGEMLSVIDLERSPVTNNLRTNIFILPGEINFQNQKWTLARSSIRIDTSSFRFNDLRLFHDKQEMAINGRITKDSQDTLNLNFNGIDLKFTEFLFPRDKVKFEGIIKGQARIADLYGNPTFQSDLTIDSLKFNDQSMGNTRLTSIWNKKSKEIQLDLESTRGRLKTLDIEGKYLPDNQTLNFDIALDKIKMDLLNPIIENSFSDMQGVMSGQLKLTGSPSGPLLNGELIAQKTSFTIDYLQTRYHITHSLSVKDNRLLFNEATVFDNQGNKAIVDGSLYFEQLQNLQYNFKLDTREFQALSTSSNNNSVYYGDGFVSGLLNIQGNSATNLLDIDASVQTEKNTIINLPIGGTAEQKKSKFITFVSEDSGKIEQTSNYRADLSGIDLNLDLEITPQAETRLIFNPELGDMIKARGRGNLNMEVNQNENFRIYGDYIIEEGDYMFSLQNVINKKFEIQQGSQIIWNGKPQDADINVTAVYNLRTSLDNLFMDTTEFYQKRIPVKCKINLTEKLNNPNIDFEIDLPTADESTKARLNAAINTEEEMNKQFLSLLVLNTFMPAQQYLADQVDQTNLGATGMAFTTSELLSNQLSHWLSQISNNWDIGVNYQPGDEISRDQVEVALSTQLLNDRLIINGNVGSGGRFAQASEIVGDFRVDWKLTQNGKFRLKFFNRNSDRLIYEETRYIQGAGLYYREEFNTFGELIRKIAENLSLKKKKEGSNQ